MASTRTCTHLRLASTDTQSAATLGSQQHSVLALTNVMHARPVRLRLLVMTALVRDDKT